MSETAKAMSLPRKPISMIPAVGVTVAAVFELGACFLSTGHASSGHLGVILLAEMVLIAAAIAQWVMYFRRYIAWQIAEHLRNPQDKRSDLAK